MKGFVNIFKPSGMTSSDVVVKVRGILRRATGEKQKVGHLGTLDPLATGVLPIAVGNATRLFDYMQNKKKVYIATFKFGETTDTLDKGSQITAIDNGKHISSNDILQIIAQHIGEIAQIPPQYSAKSVNGRRAYDIAREGGIADLKPKNVHIYDIALLGSEGDIISTPSGEYSLSENEFAFKITCGSGTYIRAIARDMAISLGTVGYMTSLCRISTGGFSAENSVTLSEFEANSEAHILPIETALADFDVIDLNEIDGTKALNGVKIAYEYNSVAPFVVKVCGQLVGLGECVNGFLRIKTRI